jgi:hypothetical protein
MVPPRYEALEFGNTSIRANNINWARKVVKKNGEWNARHSRQVGSKRSVRKEEGWREKAKGSRS